MRQGSCIDCGGEVITDSDSGRRRLRCYDCKQAQHRKKQLAYYYANREAGLAAAQAYSARSKEMRLKRDRDYKERQKRLEAKALQGVRSPQVTLKNKKYVKAYTAHQLQHMRPVRFETVVTDILRNRARVV